MTDAVKGKVGEAVRRLGAQSVLMSAAVARRTGLAQSDLECLDLLFLGGPLAAGELMAGTGLASGSVTAMVDRLERRGLVRRERDPNDRRRVLVSVVPAAVAPIGALYTGMAERMARVLDGFSGEELSVILRFLTGSLAASIASTAELRDRGEAQPLD